MKKYINKNEKKNEPAKNNKLNFLKLIKNIQHTINAKKKCRYFIKVFIIEIFLLDKKKHSDSVNSGINQPYSKCIGLLS